MGRDSSVGIVIRYGIHGPGVESGRSQWPSGLRRGSGGDRLLGWRVRIPPAAWMFVLCVVIKDKKAKCRTISIQKQVWMKYKQSTSEYKK